MIKKSLKERFEEAITAAGIKVNWDALNELVEALEKAFADIEIMAQEAINLITRRYEELTEQTESAVEVTDNARRRRMARSRARAIEQRYRAEIRRFERDRFCRRIYKPP